MEVSIGKWVDAFRAAPRDGTPLSMSRQGVPGSWHKQHPWSVNRCRPGARGSSLPALHIPPSPPCACLEGPAHGAPWPARHTRSSPPVPPPVPTPSADWRNEPQGVPRGAPAPAPGQGPRPVLRAALPLLLGLLQALREARGAPLRPAAGGAHAATRACPCCLRPEPSLALRLGRLLLRRTHPPLRLRLRLLQLHRTKLGKSESTVLGLLLRCPVLSGPVLSCTVLY